MCASLIIRISFRAYCFLLVSGNILLTRNCQLRISDFGLARELPKDTDHTAETRRDGDGMTEVSKDTQALSRRDCTYLV